MPQRNVGDTGRSSRKLRDIAGMPGLDGLSVKRSGVPSCKISLIICKLISAKTYLPQRAMAFA